MFDLGRLIAAASNLEPLPASVTRLARLVSREDVDIKEILEVITFDEALTAKLLRSANSATAASSTPVTHVKDAVIRMGLGTVLSLSVAASVKAHTTSAIPEYALEEGYLWKHSVTAALSTEVMQSNCSIRLPAESFTAALMHDIGKLVLSRFLNSETRSLFKQVHKNGNSITSEIETELLGVHHGEVGGLVAQYWKLPDLIVRGISHHHYPETGGSIICFVVALADIVAKQIDKKLDVKILFDQHILIMDQLKINPNNFEKICNAAALKFEFLHKKYD